MYVSNIIFRMYMEIFIILRIVDILVYKIYISYVSIDLPKWLCTFVCVYFDYSDRIKYEIFHLLTACPCLSTILIIVGQLDVMLCIIIAHTIKNQCHTENETWVQIT